MAYPQGYLYQPSASLALYSCPAYGTGVLSGPRTEELGRSSSGSAFAPYAGSTAFSSASPGYGSHLPYGADAAAATFSSYVGSPYDHTSGMAGSIGYHPYAAPLGSYPYGDPAYRKNATRDATATLKAWLNEHRKNPYPTKGEKIMLAIITKMTLTQVSTWFANARRRLKKENKMTWTPRNRSEDEDEDENIDLEKNDDDEPSKPGDKGDSTDTESDHKSLHPGDLACDRFKEDHDRDRDRDPLDPLLSDSDLKEQDDERTADSLLAGDPVRPRPPAGAAASPPPLPPGAAAGAAPPPPRAAERAEPGRPPPPPDPHRHGAATSVIHSPPSAPKPKLWSLAEIATSSDRSPRGGGADPPGSGGRSADASPSRSSPQRHGLPAGGAVLARPLYYASPFYPGYTNYGGFGPLTHGPHGPHVSHGPHGAPGPGAGPGAHLNGLNQTVFSRAEALVRESQKARSQTQLDLFKDSPYELKKGMSHI